MHNQRQKRINSSRQDATSSCWSCGNTHATSTSKIVGQLRRLCEDCVRIAEKDIEMKGRLRELLGYMTWEGTVPNKHRRKVELLCRHRYVEIARLAEELLTETSFKREMSVARRERNDGLLESITNDYETWIESRVERLGQEIAEQL